MNNITYRGVLKREKLFKNSYRKVFYSLNFVLVPSRVSNKINIYKKYNGWSKICLNANNVLWWKHNICEC